MADYQPIYTSIDRIQARTKGLHHFGQSPHIGGRATDLDLLLIIIEQQESFVKEVLAQIYEMPLLYRQPIVIEIVENLVMRELMGNNPAQSTPTSVQMPFTAGRAEFLLQLLTVGHNIAIPGVPPMPSIPGASTPQPIVLPGERFRSSPPDTLTRSVTVLGDRRYMAGKLYKDLGIDFGGTSSDRPSGGERKVI